MADLNETQLREHAKEQAKTFKASWMELGRVLHTIWKDKTYKFWEFSNFDNYAFKELGIRNTTAAKLLRSYLFLETKEPQYLSKEYVEKAEPAQVPNYEAVNRLRVAGTHKDLTESDYKKIKEAVFEKGKDERDVAKDLTTLIQKRREESGDDMESREDQARRMVLRRFLSGLKSTERELDTLKIVPKKVLDETRELIAKIETYL